MSLLRLLRRRPNSTKCNMISRHTEWAQAETWHKSRPITEWPSGNHINFFSFSRFFSFMFVPMSTATLYSTVYYLLLLQQQQQQRLLIIASSVCCNTSSKHSHTQTQVQDDDKMDWWQMPTSPWEHFISCIVLFSIFLCFFFSFSTFLHSPSSPSKGDTHTRTPHDWVSDNHKMQCNANYSRNNFVCFRSRLRIRFAHSFFIFSSTLVLKSDRILDDVKRRVL